MQGKRAGEDHRPTWQNMVRPTGFMFSMAKGKKSNNNLETVDESMLDDDTVLGEILQNNTEDENDEMIESREQRSLTNIQPKDYTTFFAGRGKRDSTRIAGNHNPTKSINSFFAGRGKKGTD
jgi:hypothetical protein